MRRSVGSFEVVALLDASGTFFCTRDEAFPDADAGDWERARRLDPGAFGVGGDWLLDFRCFAIFGPSDWVGLVDAGVGPVGSPAQTWTPVPGRLPQLLRAEGIEPADVDVVVLTHLHEDHDGWAVGPTGTPFFTHARYVLQHAEVAALSDEDVAARHIVTPLREAGQLHLVHGETRIDPGRDRPSVTAVPTPGHTPGHQSVLVGGGEGSVVVSGDVLVHAVQLVNPRARYAYESDHELARQSRVSLLAHAGRERATLATAHLRQPFLPTW